MSLMSYLMYESDEFAARDVQYKAFNQGTTPPHRLRNTGVIMCYCPFKYREYILLISPKFKFVQYKASFEASTLGILEIHVYGCGRIYIFPKIQNIK